MGNIVNDRNDENLKKLLEQFMNPEQAQMHLEDIERGEEILREHPAPEPDDMLLANIKAQIALHAMPHKKTGYKWVAYKVVAVAAAVIILATVWTSLYEQPIPVRERDIEISSVFPWDHQDSTVFNTELELLENDLQVLKYGQEDVDNDSAMTELEFEVIEIAGDFWKG
jgi:hypothetical protein